MATNILTAERKKAAGQWQYLLPESDRQAMLADADNPSGQMHHSQLKIIEQQRQTFIRLNGGDGTQNIAA